MLDPGRADGIARLRAAFEAHGYARPEAAAVLGVAAGSETRRIDLPLYLRRLDPASPLHTQIRLFALQLPAPREAARAALAPLGLDEAAALGVVALDAEEVRPRVGFVTLEGLVLARDLPAGGTAALEAEHVLGLNPPALMLARLTVRRPVRSALDLGCGGGVQALIASRFAERVVGVDKNPRAVAYARFNARLNGITNVEFREGDLFAPVADERFELVVCNPPYVISPESELLFRDGGRRGDAFCAEVVRGAARVLAPEGFASVLVNWIVRAGQHWSEPLREWVEGSGCDAWLAHLETSDPLSYAAGWNRSGDSQRYAAALDRWLAYYAGNAIAAIGMGAVVLRKREAPGAPWVAAVELPARPRDQAGDAIRQAFAAQDRLAQLADDGALLGARFAVAPDVRVAQLAALREGRFEATGAELRLDGPLPVDAAADAGTLRLLQLCDGRQTLGEVVAAMGEGDAGLAASVAQTARRLITLGFLIPAEAGERGKDERADRFEPEAEPAPPRVLRDRGAAGPRRDEAGAGPR